MKKYEVIHEDKVLYCYLPGKNKVLSTSVLNGGIHEDIRLVYNLDCKPEKGIYIHLEGGSYESHLRWYAKEKLKTLPEYATGYLTAAQMENVAVAEMTYPDSEENAAVAEMAYPETEKNAVVAEMAYPEPEENAVVAEMPYTEPGENAIGSFAVKAVVTGGIDKNGSRVGEDAHWHENAGVWHPTDSCKEVARNPGTINIMLFITANLTDGALTRALVTCTEAKTAAIQELCLPSLYSNGLATGSGTDGTIIVSDMDSPLLLTEAGKHTKLGELIGKCVKQAVKEALIRQTHVAPENRRNVFCFLGRFGCTGEKLLEQLKKEGITQDMIDAWASDSLSLGWAHMEAHLLDLYHWEMITRETYEDSHRRIKNAWFPSCREDIQRILEMAEQLVRKDI